MDRGGGRSHGFFFSGQDVALIGAEADESEAFKPPNNGYGHHRRDRGIYAHTGGDDVVAAPCAALGVSSYLLRKQCDTGILPVKALPIL